MEETHLISVLGRQIQLKTEDFIAFTEIISTAQLSELFTFLKLPNLNEKVITIMTYYIVKVFKQISQTSLSNYNQHCCSKLEEHYIKEKMFIDVYDYSLICSRILSKKLVQCIHIIYYLIYGRFASKYYVDALVKEKNAPEKKIVLKKRRAYSRIFDKSFSTKGKNQSMNMTTIFDNAHINLEMFQLQLKSVLNITNFNTNSFSKDSEKNKKIPQLKSDYKAEVDSIEVQNINPHTQGQLHHENLSLRALPLPSKVHKYENSSIINAMTKGALSNNSKMKIHMRKQKFIEHFNVQKYFRNTSSEYFNKAFQTQMAKSNRISTAVEQHCERQSNNKRQKIPGGIQKTQKRTFDLFTGIATKIKVMNANLDEIRSNCLEKLNFQEKPIKKQSFTIGKLTDLALSSHPSPPPPTLPQQNIKIAVNQRQVWKTSKCVQTKIAESVVRNSIQLEQSELVSLGVPPLMKTKKSFLSSRMEIKQLENRSTMNKISINQAVFNPNQTITRKNDSGIKDEEADLMVFGKNTKKSTTKLQQYKEQYRKFVKSQLFDRQNANN